ncbi:hypothetical protein [Fictibacillus fluitans]|uniref:Uncharacterized protein n=1 Tax=Fictibacillus fluitans TaxID=3058422 RepID=A0ABT8HVT1_9BACL|nr:hypothetical protein [Fictibacillus sp. NE201]MDN4524887.1 hypothetical protein [Fictibacillus sp. NE201]
MKIFLITVFMYIFLTAFSYILDLVQGYSPRTAYMIELSPFKVMELIEVIVAVTLIAFFFLQSVFQIFTKKRSPK